MPYPKGKPHSEETKAKMRAAHAGRPGRSQTAATRLRISSARAEHEARKRADLAMTGQLTGWRIPEMRALQRAVAEKYGYPEFWRHVYVAGPGECWPWMGARLPEKGYGTYRGGVNKVYSHRFAYECAIDAIPPGLDVCHKCDSPPCCNPDDLFTGTRQVNLQDMWSKGRGSRHGQPGEMNAHARLTEAQVADIRRRYAAGGTSYRLLAQEFGTHKSTIASAVKGRTWKHVESGESTRSEVEYAYQHGKPVRYLYRAAEDRADEMGIVPEVAF